MTDKGRARHDWLEAWWGFVIVLVVAVLPMTLAVLLGWGPVGTLITAGLVLLILIAVSAAKGKNLQERVSLLLSLLAVAGVVTVLANLQKEAEERTPQSQVDATIADLMDADRSWTARDEGVLVTHAAIALYQLPPVTDGNDPESSSIVRKRACNVLLRIAKEAPNASVKCAAVTGLGKAKCVEAGETILELFREEEDTGLRVACARALAGVGHMAAVSDLIVALDAEATGLMWAAAEALASLGGEEAEEELRRAAEGPPGRKREAATRVLDRRGDG